MFNPSYSGFECKADCPDRKVGCRSGCEKWKRDKAKREQIRKERKKNDIVDLYQQNKQFEVNDYLSKKKGNNKSHYSYSLRRG